MIEHVPEDCVCDGRAFGCWDWSKGSLALVASDGEKAVILQHTGGALDYWLSEVGDTEAFDGVEAGLWVWEGNLKSRRDYWGEYDGELDGDLRKLTAEEWRLVQDDDRLWNDSDRFRCPGKDRQPAPTTEEQPQTTGYETRDLRDENG